jgi:hypothetical protein
MQYTVKLIDLSPWEINFLKRALRYYINHGIKITYLKKVVFIHCDSDKPYQGLLNVMFGFTRTNRLICNQKTSDWLSLYPPFKPLS